MKPDQYWVDLNKAELFDNDPELAFAIEAAHYCVLYDEKCIRRARLTKICGDSLNEATNGARSTFGGNTKAIINRSRDRGFLIIERIGLNKTHTRSIETWISPNIEVIDRKVIAMQTEIREKLSAANMQRRDISKYSKVNFPNSLTEPLIPIESVSISESLARQVSKTRALVESVHVSGTVNAVVTRAKSPN